MKLGFLLLLASLNILAAMKGSPIEVQGVEAKRMCVQGSELSLDEFVTVLLRDDVEVLMKSPETLSLDHMLPIIECYDVMSPLMIAAHAGSLETCRFLLDNGASVDAMSRVKGLDALQIAFLNSQFGVIELLKKYGFDYNHSMTSLLLSEIEKDGKASHTLIQRILDALDYSGMEDQSLKQAFMYALQRRQSTSIICRLVQAVLKCKTIDEDDDLYLLQATLYWISTKQAHQTGTILASVLEPLCGKFQKLLNKTDASGKSLLHKAASSGMFSSCFILAHYGAHDPECLDIFYENDGQRKAQLDRVMRAGQLRSHLMAFAQGHFDEDSPVAMLPFEIVKAIVELFLASSAQQGAEDRELDENRYESVLNGLTQCLPSELAHMIGRNLRFTPTWSMGEAER